VLRSTARRGPDEPSTGDLRERRDCPGPFARLHSVLSLTPPAIDANRRTATRASRNHRPVIRWKTGILLLDGTG